MEEDFFEDQEDAYSGGMIGLKADSSVPIAENVDIGVPEGACDLFYMGTIIYTDGREYVINGSYYGAIGQIGSDGKATFIGGQITLQSGGSFDINRMQIVAVPQSEPDALYTFNDKPEPFPLTATKGKSSSSVKSSVTATSGEWVKIDSGTLSVKPEIKGVRNVHRL